MTSIDSMNNPLINNELIQKIDQILPQTQCTKCGYPDCLAYATAISEGAPHNQCPPGKDEGIAKLSALLNRPVLPLNLTHGKIQKKVRAFIREDECIGCTKCIQACPVDAIIGSAKKMHTVIESECTGCDLCVSPCPVDCIDLIELPEENQPESLSHPKKIAIQDHARNRHQARSSRLLRLESLRLEKHRALKNQHKNQLSIQTALSFSSETPPTNSESDINRLPNNTEPNNSELNKTESDEN
jgi:electron transport complex protein RnfB